MKTNRMTLTAAVASAAIALSSTTLVVGAASAAPGGHLNLSGVTLNIGNIGGLAPVLMNASGALAGAAYKVNYSSFQDGTSTVAALQGGSIDFGQTADTPAIFALAAGVPLHVAAVAIPKSPGAAYGIVVAKNSPITSIAQLKGKSIAAPSGTIMQYLTIAALTKAKVNWKSVTIDNLTPLASLAALQGGAVQAATLSQPYISIAQAGGAKVLTTGKGYTNGYGFLLGSNSALASPTKSAAFADYLKRVANANVWGSKHISTWAAAVHAANPAIPVGLATVLLTTNLSNFTQVNSTVIGATQTEANVFTQIGLLPSKLKVQNVFSTQFNSAVANLPKV